MTGTGEPTAHTVTIAGPERHDGEAPYTYVVAATDVADAQDVALTAHLLDEGFTSDPAQLESDGLPVFAFVAERCHRGMPPESGYLNELRACPPDAHHSTI